MGTGPGQILGSSVDGTTGNFYMMDVTHQGAIPISGTININNIAGSIVIGSVSASVDSIYVTSGNTYIQSGANMTGSFEITNAQVPISGVVTVNQSSIERTITGGSVNIMNEPTVSVSNFSDLGSEITGSVAITNIVSVSGVVGVEFSNDYVNVIQSGNSWSVSGTVYNGSVIELQSLPTDSNMNNPKWTFEYDNDGNVGSVYQVIGAGSYVNVITWTGYSGVLPGIGSRVTNVSEWSVV